MSTVFAKEFPDSNFKEAGIDTLTKINILKVESEIHEPTAATLFMYGQGNDKKLRFHFCPL